MAAYGKVTRKTLVDALAYVHISQGMRGLHLSTRSALMGFYDFQSGITNDGHYRLTHEGLELAKASPYWVAYEWLKANGYRRKQFEKHCMRLITYWNPSAYMDASIHRDGSVFLYPESGLWKDRTRRLSIEDMKKELNDDRTEIL